MTKSTKISLLFILIFLVGILLFITYINTYLNNSHSYGNYSAETEEVEFYYSHQD